jgi:hypothetical protein
MVRCKLCGGEYRGLELHLTACLKKHNITREKYTDLPDKVVVEEVKVLENEFKEVEAETAPVIEKQGISHKEIVSNIFKGSVEKKDPNRPFSEALAEYGISEKEFTNILKFWSGEGKVPLDMRIDRRIVKGKEEATKLSNDDNVTTPNLDTAESLVKDYGFKVVTVRGATDKSPKVWVLRKK